MKLEIGKKYLNRNGQVHGPMKITKSHPDRFTDELARLRRENDALRAERDEWKRRALENSAQLVRDAFEQKDRS